jgi:hypothetical protein
MTTAPLKTSATLLIDDQGAALYQDSGELLHWMPTAEAGAEKRGLWAAAIRERVAAGTEIQILLGQSGLLIQCQEAPFLSMGEQRDVATRVFAAESGEAHLLSAAALDADPVADGGHVLWLAAQARADMDDWVAAIQGAGCLPVYAIPFQRALLRGLDSLPDPLVDRIVLAMDPGLVGHLCIFHGRFLSLQRTFLLPAEPAEAEEVIFEEVSRLLQFYKQKNRTLAFRSIQVLGLPELSRAFQDRILGSLRLEPSFIAPDLWPVLQEGLQRDRGRKDGLNLLPLELQEASQRRVFRNLVWAASLTLGLLFVGASLFLYSQEALLEREVARSAQLLAEREAHTAEEERVVQARLPLLRVRLAEQRQERAMVTLGALGTAIFQPPAGIQLEKVEVLEQPGDEVAHTFQITGMAFTERSFSVGPLAQYLVALGRQTGVTLLPVTEVTISDRVVDGREKHVDQMAITRFTLKGSAK